MWTKWIKLKASQILNEYLDIFFSEKFQSFITYTQTPIDAGRNLNVYETSYVRSIYVLCLREKGLFHR